MDPRSSHPQHSPSEGFPISLPNGQSLALGIEEFSISSSSTASNLPGPSRVIGKMFSWMGAGLEQRIDVLADKLGYGPLALRRKLEAEGLYYWWSEPWDKRASKNRRRKVMKLIKYIWYVQVLYYRVLSADFKLFGEVLVLPPHNSRLSNSFAIWFLIILLFAMKPWMQGLVPF